MGSFLRIVLVSDTFGGNPRTQAQNEQVRMSMHRLGFTDLMNSHYRMPSFLLCIDATELITGLFSSRRSSKLHSPRSFLSCSMARRPIHVQYNVHVNGHLVLNIDGGLWYSLCIAICPSFFHILLLVHALSNSFCRTFTQSLGASDL